jgi:hypothetical protein
MFTKPSQLLAAIGWASVFAEAWALLTRNIPADALSWGMWVFFLIIAVLASVISMSKN